MITYFPLTLLILGCYCDDQVPVVQTPLGTVSGHYLTSHSGRKFAAFEGIPYAVPPIGERRFKEPEVIKPWNGVWNATSKITCAQTDIFEPYTPNGFEDCLYINVYVPRTTPNSGESLDVIIHIHGGAYMYGSGHEYSNPKLLMDKEIIFVTFNYRLGILGFLSTEDEVVPGNNGLKDQVLALEWVQQNIANFGGNSDSVTLTGLSAGGSSVHFHYFSKRSRGLFHRGFSQSGVALNPWSIAEEPLNKAKKLATSVGCPSGSTELMVDCLRQKPFQELLGQISQFFGYYFLPCVPFGPVVEKAGSRPFLSADPFYLLSKGQIYDVPWMVSVTSDEGLFPIEYIGDLDVVDEKWEELAPYLLDYNYTIPKDLWSTVAKEIKQKYLGDLKISKQNLLKVAKIFTDRYFLNEAETAIKQQAKVSRSSIYFYVFSYPGDNNERQSVGHGEDGKYFFGGMPLRTDSLTPNEVKMSELLLDMLGDFAKTGKPVIKGVEWKASNFDKLNYLNINGIEVGKNKLETVEELSSRKFWDELKLAESAHLVRNKDEL